MFLMQSPQSIDEPRPTLKQRYRWWRGERYLRGAFPSKLWVWRMRQRLLKCDGCGKRLREKHYSQGTIYVDEDTGRTTRHSPVNHYCDTACARGVEYPS
jgi:hypothetical protein